MCERLILQGVSSAYGDKTILQNISLAFGAGTVTALIGKNGSGKTTLLKIIARQHAPTAGEIFLDNKPIESYSRKAFARKVAYMPQARNLPEITSEALVAHGRFPYLGLSRQMTAADRDAVQRAMQLTDTARLAKREVRSLSGGERQRVYLAMALAQGGELLLLDEPTTYLDAAAQFSLLSLLRELAARQGCAVVVALHDLAQALQYGDRVAVLESSKLTACDTPTEIYQKGVLDTVFGVRVCRAQDGSYYVQSRAQSAAQEDSRFPLHLSV